MTSSLLIPVIAGIGIATTSAFLGLFVISQRLSFFSDALSHAALLGISASLLLSLPLNLSFVIAGLMFACFFTYLLSYSKLNSDTLIGILAHSFLAISLLSISLFSDRSIDLEHYLFGELSKVNLAELFWVALCFVLSIVFVLKNWDALLLMTLHEDLAKAEGINTQKLRLGLTLILALLITVSIQLVGALLISALLIIPAASVQRWSNSPKHSVLLAALVANTAVLFGILFAHKLNTPSGPSIVFMASCAFLISMSFKRKNN